MDEVVRRSAAPYHFRTTVVVGFAALALLLAAVGIYGVVSVLAQARRRELAIRRALGSTGVGLMRLVVRQGLLPVGLGIALGCAGVALSARLVGSLLFGVSARNVGALGVTVLVLVATASLAMVPAALKSVAADPMSMLRLE
jgi:putative ABC transport system permease protein